MCGIMGVSLPIHLDTAIHVTFEGLRQEVNRGQDGTGIYAVDANGHQQMYKGLGLVPDVYSDDFLHRPACAAIGHNRYATQGLPSEINLQPHVARCRDGWIAVASNGDIPMYDDYRRQLEAQSVPLVSTNDGELLAWWLARAYNQCGSMPESIYRLQQEVVGAYSAVVLFQRRVYAFRDILGFRPMMTSPLPNGGFAVASEGAAFDIQRADRSAFRDVLAGTIVELADGQLTVHRPGHTNVAACLFEMMYFARQDGRVFGQSVSLFRRRTGWRLGQLAIDFDLDRAVVGAVPDSSNEMAAGVADWTGRPLVPLMIRNHSATRTFIKSEQRMRDEGVRLKFNPDAWLIEGRDILLVDDSVVRGTTMHSIIRMLRRCGACNIYLLVGSPPVRWPCFMGIATPTRSELIAGRQNVVDIRRYLGVDRLIYLPLEASLEAAGPLMDWERQRFADYLGPRVEETQLQLTANQSRSFCTACFSGQYPIPVPIEP